MENIDNNFSIQFVENDDLINYLNQLESPIIFPNPWLLVINNYI